MSENASTGAVNLDQVIAEAASKLADVNKNIPQQPDISLPQNKVVCQDAIGKVNNEFESAMIDSRAKLINLYIHCEEQRLSQQSPLLQSVINMTTTLIKAFNWVIGILSVAVIAFCFWQGDSTTLQSLLDFLKYYIGAVIAELIGLIIFIAKGVFSSNYEKIIEKVFGSDSSK